MGRVVPVIWTCRPLPSQSRYLVRATYRPLFVRRVVMMPKVPIGVRGLATSTHLCGIVESELFYGAVVVELCLHPSSLFDPAHWS